MTNISFDKRTGGVFLPIFSLPDGHGIGDFGPSARRWVDQLAEMGVGLWQICPLQPVGFGNSPYQPTSSVGFSFLFISLEDLLEEGLLNSETLSESLFPISKTSVDYIQTAHYKLTALQQAWIQFQNSPLRTEFNYFKKKNAEWLKPFSLYYALKDQQGGLPWFSWEPEFKNQNKKTIKNFEKEFRDRLEFQFFLQFLADRQWKRLRSYANKKGVQILGDLPFFVSRDSMDAWTEKALFTIGKDGQMTAQAGAPPDAQNSKGQAWGMPLYNWKAHAKNNFKWWRTRVSWAANHFDRIRLDHFSGFFFAYAVHGQASHGQFGKWKKSPGLKALKIILKETPASHFLAEDLGIRANDIQTPRGELGMMGSRILQDGVNQNQNDPINPYFRVPKNMTLFSGTHDHPPLKEWIQNRKKPKARQAEDLSGQDLSFLVGSPGENLMDALFRLGMESPAQLFIVPVQDLLGLGRESQLNVPGREGGNWEWRVKNLEIPPLIGQKFAANLQTFGRSNP